MLDIFPPIIHGTLREHYLLLFGSAGAFSLVIGFVGAWLGARLGARRLARQVAREQALVVDAQAATLEQLRQTLDLVAVEVERVAEAQRFQSKLLAERAGARAARAERRKPGEITPH